ncbi:TetR/AcrR family transcriptional regulator [Nocardia alni]|uniref:TetR/AcrR family transcriptional regulator n=1 Tax=Nocardia alni TaxID=2815723 RepID=UPI0020B40346|nr:TetR/AcrR family transcriptional regulator [Nocardia alni]
MEPTPAEEAPGAVASVLGRSLEQQIERHRFPEGYRRIFHVAIEAFAERGFYATSTRDIAARAGMSPSGVFTHFKTKEEVLYRIAVAAFDLTEEITVSAANNSLAPTDRLRALVFTLTAWLAHHGASVRVVLNQLDALTPEHRDEIFDKQRAMNQLVRGIMKDGVERGEFDIPDIPITSIAVLSICVDTARWYRPGHHRTTTELGHHHANAALRMVGVREIPQS